jgi:hypothetical protein
LEPGICLGKLAHQGEHILIHVFLDFLVGEAVTMLLTQLDREMDKTGKIGGCFQACSEGMILQNQLVKFLNLL